MCVLHQEEKVTITTTGEDVPIHINTITLPGNKGQIGMTFCPGKSDTGNSGAFHDLEGDLTAISLWGAEAVITLLEKSEMEMLGIDDLPVLLKSRGIQWHHLPVRDVDIPDARFEAMWLKSGEQIRTILSRGGRILFHCLGRNNRVGTVAAKLLVEFGFKPSHAIDLVRETSPGTIDTYDQEQYVIKLRKWPKIRDEQLQ